MTAVSNNILFDNRGINAGLAQQLPASKLLDCALAEAKTRTRASLYLADLIVLLSYECVIYQEAIIYKNDLAKALLDNAREEYFPAEVPARLKRFLAQLELDLPAMTTQEVTRIMHHHCKVVSSRVLSDYLELGQQTIYNYRSVMRRYPFEQRPDDPRQVLGFSHYQDVSKANLSVVDSLRLLQEYLDAKARGGYFNEDVDTLIEATPTELKMRADALNMLRAQDKKQDTPDPQNDLPDTVSPERLQVVRATRVLNPDQANVIRELMGKEWAIDTDKPINAQVTIYYWSKVHESM